MEHILEGKELNKRFASEKGDTTALTDVSFYLDKGEVLGIVGESGSGKSTLLKVVSGMITPDSGDLFHDGKKYTGQKPRKTGEFLQVIFQDAKSSFDPRMPMERSIAEAGRGRADRALILEHIKKVGLDEELLSRKPSQLSGGQCQRMSIARAFYSGAGILLCDEITSALDVSSQAQVVKVMKNLKNDGKMSALFVSHDIALVSMICNRIMVMKDGRCVEQGEIGKIISDPQHEYTRKLIESARKQEIVNEVY
ncbi:MAG: ABC transporter ATP-binding protein [Butyrivibrio sp.]|nr:ABC transporter ATP-binding protein [Butyrivibrio sp.]